MVAKLKLVAKNGQSAGRVTRYDSERLRYVEDKPLDMTQAGEYLGVSQRANHWANFGPVSRQLEHQIARDLKLNDGLRVVMCANGSVAMHALIALHETLAGRNLRWVSSAFGYYCSIQGPLKNAMIVDCDQDALLDLKQLDPSTFDGFIVTNSFGQQNSLNEFFRYAATHGKIVVVDSAMAFGAHVHGANEIISFHHTKPWGFGEGGCAIVAAEHEALFRSLICFGHEQGEAINRRAVNGKISDVSCAFALTRLQQMSELKHTYREQYNRIAILGRQVGLGILGDVDEHPGIPASVPFLCPLPLEDYKHSVIPTGRYYHPLCDDAPAAWDIYNRIVNVPCHPGMASLKNDEIRNALENLIQRCF